MALPAGRYGVTKNQLLKIKKLPMNTIKLIEELTEKFDLLGSAAFKNSTSVVTDSTDLVESGAVKDIVGWGNKNLLPNNAKSITTKGITFAVKADGSVTANGTCTQNVDFYYSGSADSFIPLGNIQNGDILNGCTGGSANTYSIVAGNLSSGYGTCTDGDVALTDITNGIRVVIRVKQGATLNNVVFKPMIRKADVTDATYEPYHASVEDTLRDAEFIEGKNILPYFTEVKSGSGVTVTPNNGRYSFAGTATGNITLKYPVTIEASGVLKFLATGSTEGNGTNIRLYLKDKSTQATSTLMSGNTVDLSVYDITDIAFYAGNGKTPSFNNIGLMLQDASNPDTTFVPYYIPLKDVVPTKADNSVIGTVEGANASKAWSAGEHFIKDGQFKEVTNPIASGEEINSGNTTDKPIAELFKLETNSASLRGITGVSFGSQNKIEKCGKLVNIHVDIVITDEITTGTQFIQLPYTPFNFITNVVNIVDLTNGGLTNGYITGSSRIAPYKALPAGSYTIYGSYISA